MLFTFEVRVTGIWNLALVSCSKTATVQFRFTGTNSGRQPTLFPFLILLERCAHVYAQAGKSSLFKRFLGSLPITTESKFIVRFLIKEMLFSKIRFKRLKHNSVQRTGLARLKHRSPKRM